MKSYSDVLILSAIRNGEDREVLKYLYATILPVVEDYIRLNSGTSEEAFDVFQDAMVIFYKQVILGTFDDTKYKIAGYLYTISKNLWINVSKKKNRAIIYENSQSSLFEMDSTLLDLIIDKEREETLTKLFKKLGQACIELLTLSIYQGLTMREIAEKLGSTENSIKVQCHRCRKKLSDMVMKNSSLINILKN